MKATALLVVMPTLLAQTLTPSARQLVNIARPLTTAEIAIVLGASRQALTAKAFRLTNRRPLGARVRLFVDTAAGFRIASPAPYG